MTNFLLKLWFRKKIQTELNKKVKKLFTDRSEVSARLAGCENGFCCDIFHPHGFCWDLSPRSFISISMYMFSPVEQQLK